MNDSEWLISTIDQSGRISIAVVANYTASLSTVVLTSRFSFNPTLSASDLRHAVEVNQPLGLLPEPWPTADTSTLVGLEIAALTKMERVLSIVSGIRASSSEALLSSVRKTFPSISLTTVLPEYKRFRFDVQLLQDGTVTHSYEHPAEGEFPLRDCAARPLESLSSFLEAIVQADMLRSIERLIET
jgi:hypothetical protein